MDRNLEAEEQLEKREEREARRKHEGKEFKKYDKGMCFAVEIDENLSHDRYKELNEPPRLIVNFWGEGRDGITPAAGNP